MSDGRDDGGAPPLPAPLLRPGDFIAGYPIRTLVGRGGQSEIYEGFDLSNGRLVAIKVLLFKHQLNPEMRRRAKAEAELERRLDHPNIVKVYAAGVDEEKKLFYTVMELLDGETLEERLRRGRLDARETLHIAAEVADGLILLHARKVIHRDIKPDNIFLTKDGRVVLIDLGIAKLESKEFSSIRTDANILIGTFAYMSPEQIHQRTRVDPRADLYALGLVMFRCLTGRHPAWNPRERPDPPDPREYAAWHMTVVPPLASDVRPDVPINIATFVARAVEKEPERRPENATRFGILVRELIAWLDENPLPEAPEGPRPVVRPAVVSATDFWRPFGDATTQEDEGNDGPTAAGVVPSRVREPGVATLLVPAPAPPVRTTTTGTDIVEAGAIGFAPVPGRAPLPSVPLLPPVVEERGKATTGTDVVAADQVFGPALPFLPRERTTEPLRAPPREPETGAAPAAPRAATTAAALPAPRVVSATPAPEPETPVPGASVARSGEATRTTSGHLVSVPPPSDREGPPRRAAWLVAAAAGALFGMVVLFFLAPPPQPDAQASGASFGEDAGAGDAGDASAQAAEPADAGPPDAEQPDAATSANASDAGDAGPADAGPSTGPDAGSGAGTKKSGGKWGPPKKPPPDDDLMDEDDDDLWVKKKSAPPPWIDQPPAAPSAKPSAAATAQPARTNVLPFGKSED